jgi:hypothetical protein
MFPLSGNRRKAELIYSYGLCRYYSFELDSRLIPLRCSFSVLRRDILRSVLPVKVLSIWRLSQDCIFLTKAPD